VLRSLSQLEAIEYVPPFRGRAIHFRKRDVPFDQLKIDFQTLDARKAADYDKLDQTIAYAQGKLCRQMAVLRYFGDPEARPCGSCDRCLNQSGWFTIDPGPSSAHRDSDAGDVPIAIAPDASATQQEAAVARSVRKVLQAVGRLHGRLGKTLVAQFLTGSENAKIQRLRLSKLEGFGLLKAWKQAEANGLLESLLSAGVLEQTELQKHRPLLGLSALGKEVAAGKELLPTGIRWPGAVAMRLRSLDGMPSTSAKQPDVVAKPKEAAAGEGQESPGRSNFKGDVSEATATQSSTKGAAIEDPVDGGLPESDHWEWTWRLANAGYTLAQCAASRRKTWREVLRDLRRAAQQGRPLEIDQLLDPDLCQLLRSKWSLERDRQLGQLDYGQELIGLWQSLQTKGRGA
jgi:ATP-dependent DNA helicase RecQ